MRHAVIRPTARAMHSPPTCQAIQSGLSRSNAEAQSAAAAGIDAIVAQGYEAGGHRGVFDPAAPDTQLGTLALTRLLVRELDLPVIAAGGIMDGAGIAAVAQHRGIQLRSVAATVEGAMDLQGILGIDSDVRNGFSGIKVTYDIDADASRDEIKALVAQSQKRSAVFDILTNPTDVSVSTKKV